MSTRDKILAILQRGPTDTVALKEAGVPEGTARSLLLNLEREGLVVSELKKVDRGPKLKIYTMVGSGPQRETPGEFEGISSGPDHQTDGAELARELADIIAQIDTLKIRKTRLLEQLAAM